MRIELEVGDRVRRVEIQHRRDGYHVSIDGRAHIVDSARVADGTWSLLLRDPEGTSVRSVEAVVTPRAGNGGFDVHIAGHHVPVLLRGGLGRRAREVSGGRGAGRQRVTAPMPGKVVRVLVKPGDEVKARQGLVVIEAMKMENELRSPKGGTIIEVRVAEGMLVEAKKVLVVIA
jgi:biotin carboxyl carrier protein